MEEAKRLNGDVKLYDELGELARYLETAMRKMSEVGAPIAANSSQLPQATAHLLDLNKTTDECTLEVMRLTEIIQDNRARAVKELARWFRHWKQSIVRSSRRVWEKQLTSWRRTTSI